MPIKPWLGPMVAVVAWCSGAIAESDVFPWDPVALTQGHEISGRDSLAVDRPPYLYRFASDESKAAFERDPERFEVQMGGACGRMGPLSGAGSSERYAVHEGRIYVFASDSCKATFLKAPADFIERTQSFEGASEPDLASGREWIERAVAGMGGAPALDALHAYHEWEEKKTASGDREYLVRRDLAMHSDGRWIRRESWDEAWSAFRVRGDEGVSASARGDERVLAPSQRAAVRRMFLRKPALLLRHRAEPGFHAVDLGDSPTREGRRLVRVWFDGDATTLEIDTNTARVAAIEYAGRGPDLRAARVRTEFGDFREVAGLTLPHAWSLTHNGDAHNASERKVDMITLNDEPGVERVFTASGG